MLLHQLNNRTCHHCNALASFFVLMAQPEATKRHVGSGRMEWIESNVLRAFVSCSICRQPSMVTLKPKTSVSGHELHNGPMYHTNFLNRLRPLADIFKNAPENIKRNWAVIGEEPGTTIDQFYEVVQEFPKGAVQVPEESALPPAVNTQLKALANILHEPTYAMLGCRRTLEAACKEKLGDTGRGKKLYELIDLALQEMETTKEISDWAHTIRHLGNDAAHEDTSDVTDEDAKQAFEVVKLMLDLLFVYPKRIRTLREGRKA
jgi:hypothetical protein